MKKVPSNKFKKEIYYKIIRTILGRVISEHKIEDILEEVETSPGLLSDIADLIACKENGIASDETITILAGFNKEESTKAKEDFVERLKKISASQGQGIGAARGVDDLEVDPTKTAGKIEKQQDD